MSQRYQMPLVQVAPPGQAEQAWWDDPSTPISGSGRYGIGVRRARRAQELAARAGLRQAQQFIGPMNSAPAPYGTISLDPLRISNPPGTPPGASAPPSVLTWDGRFPTDSPQPSLGPINPNAPGGTPVEEPAWFQPADTWLGQIQRDTARAFSFGDVGGALKDAWKDTAVGGVIQSWQQAANSGGEEARMFVEEALSGKPSPLRGEREKRWEGLTAKQRTAVERPAVEQLGMAILSTPGAVLGVAPKPLMQAFDRLGRLLRKGIGGVAMDVEKIALGDQSQIGQLDDRATKLRAVFGGADFTAGHRQRAEWTSLNQAPQDTPESYAREAVLQTVWSGFAEPREPGTTVPMSTRRVYDRVLMGENAEVARDGFVGPSVNAYPSEMRLWQSRVDDHLSAKARIAYADARLTGLPEERARVVAQDAYDEAARFINATNFIPGENNPLKDLIGDTVVQVAAGVAAAKLGGATPKLLPEALGLRKGVPAAMREFRSYSPGAQIKLTLSNAAQFALDPGTKVPLSRIFGLQRFYPKRTAQVRAAWLDQVYDETAQAQVQASIAGRTVQAEARRTKAEEMVSSPNAATRIFGKAYLKYSDLVSRTDASRARVRSGLALQVVKDVALSSASAAEATDRLARLVLDPEGLAQEAPQLGSMPKSIRAQIARPVIVESIDRLGKLPSLTDAEWNPLRFLADVNDVLYASAKGVEKVQDRDPNPIIRFGDSVRSWMGEFYLRWPGYIMRNAASDYVTMATDGLLSFDSGAEIQQWFSRAEISPTRSRPTTVRARAST
jgi:hypothetical protein